MAQHINMQGKKHLKRNDHLDVYDDTGHPFAQSMPLFAIMISKQQGMKGMYKVLSNLSENETPLPTVWSEVEPRFLAGWAKSYKFIPYHPHHCCFDIMVSYYGIVTVAIRLALRSLALWLCIVSAHRYFSTTKASPYIYILCIIIIS